MNDFLQASSDRVGASCHRARVRTWRDGGGGIQAERRAGVYPPRFFCFIFYFAFPTSDLSHDTLALPSLFASAEVLSPQRTLYHLAPKNASTPSFWAFLDFLSNPRVESPALGCASERTHKRAGRLGMVVSLPLPEIDAEIVFWFSLSAMCYKIYFKHILFLFYFSTRCNINSTYHQDMDCVLAVCIISGIIGGMI